MPNCVWSTTSETDHGVEFTCSTCSRVIEFVKPAYGTPNPVSDGLGGWVPPENVLDWMDPCP